MTGQPDLRDFLINIGSGTEPVTERRGLNQERSARLAERLLRLDEARKRSASEARNYYLTGRG